MSAIQPTNTSGPAHELSGRLVLLLATGAGLCVAALYYSQSMLGVIGPDIHASPGAVGLVTTLTQLGYAFGILLLAPLGDRYDRRRIILIKATALTVALLLSGFAPGIGSLLAASFAVGLTATAAQDIVPAAATLAPEAQRGKIVGTVMTGLLLGILLSRVVSGLVAQQFGWRALYFAAAASIVAIGIAVWRGLPAFHPTTQLGYRALLGSMADLWRRHKPLRRATLAQGLLSVSFSAFWSTLAVMLHESFHLGSATAGSFGLAGAAGALAAPLAGRLADRRGPEIVTQAGAALVMLSFVLMGVASLFDGHTQLVLIAVGTVGFDFGIQASLVAHQTIVYGVEPGARSRLNAVLFSGMFISMSTGAALGDVALGQWGWLGVVGLATLAAAAALVVRLLSARELSER